MQLNRPSTLWKPEKLDKIEIFLKKENLFEAPEGYQGSEELRIKIRDKKLRDLSPDSYFSLRHLLSPEDATSGVTEDERLRR